MGHNTNNEQSHQRKPRNHKGAGPRQYVHDQRLRRWMNEGVEVVIRMHTGMIYIGHITELDAFTIAVKPTMNDVTRVRNERVDSTIRATDSAVFYKSGIEMICPQADRDFYRV